MYVSSQKRSNIFCIYVTLRAISDYEGIPHFHLLLKKRIKKKLPLFGDFLPAIIILVPRLRKRFKNSFFRKKKILYNTNLHRPINIFTGTNIIQLGLKILIFYFILENKGYFILISSQISF